MDKHRTEQRNPVRKEDIRDGWVKDCLSEYSELFRPVFTLMEDHVEECVYGQEGFGHHTFEEMWDLYWGYKTAKQRPLEAGGTQPSLQGYLSVKRWLDASVKSHSRN